MIDDGSTATITYSLLCGWWPQRSWRQTPAGGRPYSFVCVCVWCVWYSSIRYSIPFVATAVELVHPRKMETPVVCVWETFIFWPVSLEEEKRQDLTCLLRQGLTYIVVLTSKQASHRCCFRTYTRLLTWKYQEFVCTPSVNIYIYIPGRAGAGTCFCVFFLVFFSCFLPRSFPCFRGSVVPWFRVFRLLLCYAGKGWWGTTSTKTGEHGSSQE